MQCCAMARSAGVTLIELLVALAVAAALLHFALPAFSYFVASQRATAFVNQTVGAIALTRATAVMRGGTATLCPSRDGTSCSERDTWHEGALIFADLDGNGVRDAEDATVTALPPLTREGRAYWRSFRNRASMSFDPRGLTRWQNGHFLYCPATRDPRLFRQVIVNYAGRTRVARDADGDGVAEDASGRPLACPDAQ